MSKVLITIILASASSCQQHVAVPEQPAALVGGFEFPPKFSEAECLGLELRVTGKAPGLLHCTLENKGEFSWDFIGYSDAPSVSIKYWDGYAWRRPHILGCGTGTGLQIIAPGEVWEFRQYASYSFPKIQITVWQSYFDQKGETQLVTIPPHSLGGEKIISDEWT